MGFATSNQTSIRVIKESTFGQTPSTPAFQELRYTGETLNHNIENVTSDEIRADRMTSDLIQVGAMNEGDVSLEMSYSSYDLLLEGVMASAWGTPTDIVDDTTIQVDSSSSVQAGSSIFGSLSVGDWVRISGFTNPLNNGFFKINAVTGTTLDFDQSTMAVESAGNNVSIYGGASIKNGVTPISYTFQKFLSDATTPTYIQYNGCRVGSLDLSFDTAAILTGSIGVMGTISTASDSPISGQSVLPATTTEVMNSVNNVSDIFIDDAISAYYFSSLSLNINNNLRGQSAIGSLPAINIALSRLSVTGSITFYFEDKSQYEKYINGTNLSLSFRVEDPTGNSYVFTLPNIEFSSGSITAGSLDTDVFMEAEFEAILDTATSAMVQIDRFPV